MIKAARERVFKLIAGKTFAGDDEIYLFLVLCVATLFAGTMHLLLLAIMLALGVWLLAILNIASVGVYFVVVWLLVKRRTYVLAGLTIAVEVIGYTLFASFYIGAGSYIILYYFVLLLMQLTIPYAGIKVRVGVSAVAWVALNISLAAGEFFNPIHPIGSGSALMSVFNVQLAFFGIIIELSIGNAIRGIIQSHNADRMSEYKSKANTDHLTGLYNRWYAEKFFAGLGKDTEGCGWCVAMLDIDDFKIINDTMGHPVGDEVLRSLAEVMRSSLRKTDVLFRWGGEEFLLFLADVEFPVAVEILEKLRRVIAGTPVAVAGYQISYTVTIGAARLELDDVEGSIARCDERMYYGKTHGKNMVVPAEGSGEPGGAGPERRSG